MSTPSGVTGNVLGSAGGYALPRGVISLDGSGSADAAEAAAWLDTAAALSLNSVPCTAEACGLVDALVGMVVAQGGKRRGPKLRAKLSQAIGAITGGVLMNWSRPVPRPVYRSGNTQGFSDGPVPARQFIAAVTGLGGLGLLQPDNAVSSGSPIGAMG